MLKFDRVIVMANITSLQVQWAREGMGNIIKPKIFGK